MIFFFFFYPPQTSFWSLAKMEFDSACQWRRFRSVGLIPGSERSPWSRKWQPSPVSLIRKFHGQRSLVGYNESMGSQESDMTEHASLN